MYSTLHLATIALHFSLIHIVCTPRSAAASIALSQAAIVRIVATVQRFEHLNNFYQIKSLHFPICVPQMVQNCQNNSFEMKRHYFSQNTNQSCNSSKNLESSCLAWECIVTPVIVNTVITAICEIYSLSHT